MGSIHYDLRGPLFDSGVAFSNIVGTHFYFFGGFFQDQDKGHFLRSWGFLSIVITLFNIPITLFSIMIFDFAESSFMITTKLFNHTFHFFGRFLVKDQGNPSFISTPPHFLTKIKKKPQTQTPTHNHSSHSLPLILYNKFLKYIS